MTTIKRIGGERRSPRASGSPPAATARLRLAVRTLIAVFVVLAVAALGSAAPPATTLLLGSVAVVWVLLSFDEERPT